jgi:hypothetical protein
MKKTGILIIVLVVALAAVGVGYAAWSQTLDISGTATVATFDVSMVWDNSGTATITDEATGVSAGSTVGVYQPTDSEATNFTVVANTTADLETYNAGNAGLIVEITNAVPGSYTIPGVKVFNNSSIPVGVTVTALSYDVGNPDTEVTVDVGGFTAAVDQNVLAGAYYPSSAGTDITITITNDATQTSTYKFLIGVSAGQS